MALFARSRAKDAIPIGAITTDGVTPLCPSFGTSDQRGVPRPQGAACDIGAYERIAVAALSSQFARGPKIP